MGSEWIWRYLDFMILPTIVMMMVMEVDGDLHEGDLHDGSRWTL
jgi:hypothetical protein